MSFALRVFDLELVSSEQISASLKRFTFKGDALADMIDPAPDQRVKLLFPAPNGQPSQIEDSAEAVKNIRQLDIEVRPIMRVYTIRHFRQEASEIDVEFVLHGVNGPASRWATHAKAGDRLQMIGVSRSREGGTGGFEWRPPKDVERVLVMGDETALPAVAGIIEELAAQDYPPTTQVYIEVPLKGDCIDLPKWDGLEVNWLVREELEVKRPELIPGTLLQEAAQQATIPDDIQKVPAEDFAEIDIEKQKMWEAARAESTAFYVWVAGESTAVLNIRRYLIKEVGLQREMLNLMGYWRYGKEES